MKIKYILIIAILTTSVFCLFPNVTEAISITQAINILNEFNSLSSLCFAGNPTSGDMSTLTSVFTTLGINQYLVDELILALTGGRTMSDIPCPSQTIGINDPSNGNMCVATDGSKTCPSSSSFSSTFNECVVSAVTPSITFTSSIGGETWKTGETHTIYWNLSDQLGGSTVSLTVNDDSSKNSYSIVSDVASYKGSYTWTIPSAIKPSSKLKINISWRTWDGTLLAQNASNYFSVIIPSITITSPGKGETWKTGETHNITWTISGIQPTDHLQIEAIDSYNQNVIPIASNTGLTADAAYYSWVIPSIPTSAIYNIYILDLTSGKYFISNGLTITLPPPPPPSVSNVSLSGCQLGSFCSWIAGNTKTINWNYSNFPSDVSTVSLYFYNPSTGAYTVFTDGHGNLLNSIPASSGSYTPSISGKILTNSSMAQYIYKNQFQVKICPTNSAGTVPSNAVCGASRIITIVTPSVSNVIVSNCKTGTNCTWQEGTVQSLLWNYANFAPTDDGSTSVVTVSLNFCNPLTGACIVFMDGMGNASTAVPSFSSSSNLASYNVLLGSKILSNTSMQQYINNSQFQVKICPTNLLGQFANAPAGCATSPVITITNSVATNPIGSTTSFLDAFIDALHSIIK